MSKERAAKVMQEIFSKGTYEGDLLGINEGRKMKDTVTYPLSAIMGEEENRIEHLERELAEAKEQLRLCNVDQFTTAAELAEAVTKERERCAKVCDEMDEAFITIYGTDYTDFQNDPRYLQMAAEAIRKGE